jgi:hypothetical protein
MDKKDESVETMLNALIQYISGKTIIYFLNLIVRCLIH